MDNLLQYEQDSGLLRISTELKGLAFLALKGLVLVGLWLALKMNFTRIIHDS